MRQMTAFIKKEWMYYVRSGKLVFLGILFVLVGIMNPAVAKLTPWLLETLADDPTTFGILEVGEIIVTAMDSWTQFFKNVPMVLIVFCVMSAGHLTDEYKQGTLINMLTKGLMRPNILLSKLIASLVVWTLGYALTFGITYAYSAYFWDNSVALHLVFSVLAYYLMTVWLITVIYLASALADTTVSVLLATGGTYGVSYLLGLLPKVKDFVPTHLADGMTLLTGKNTPKDFLPVVILTVGLIAINVTVGVLCFNKKKI